MLDRLLRSKKMVALTTGVILLGGCLPGCPCLTNLLAPLRYLLSPFKCLLSFCG